MPLLVENLQHPMPVQENELAPVSPKAPHPADAPAPPIDDFTPIHGELHPLEIAQPKTDKASLSSEEQNMVISLNNQMQALGEEHERISALPESSSKTRALAANKREVDSLRARFADVASFQSAPEATKAKGLKAFLNDTEKERAALVIQRAVSRPKASPEALAAGKKVRMQTVKPSEIRGFLENNLHGLKTSTGESVNLNDLSIALSREILDATKNPKLLAGNGKRLLEKGQSYAFPEFDANGKYLGKREVQLPVGLWVKLAPDQKSIELEMVGQKKGSGTFKDVYTSRPLNVDLATEKHQKTLQNAVLVAAKGGKNKELTGGVKAIQDAFSTTERQNPDLRIAGGLTHLDRTSSAGTGMISRFLGSAPIEARDVEYQGDFSKTPLSMKQNMQVLSDTAQTMQLFHDKGLVHGDLKGQNILVSDDGRGYVSDFDSLKPQGQSHDIGTPGFIDAISEKEGLQTPFTDIFALAKTASMKLFGIQAFNATSPQEFMAASNTRMTQRITDLLSESGIPVEGLAAKSPLEMLASVNRDGLSRMQLDNLNVISKQITSMLAAQSSIRMVLSENEKTIAYLKANPKILSELKGGKEKATRAMNRLYSEFPGFASFNQTLSAALKST